MYKAIHDVLVHLGDDPAYKDDWTKIDFMTGACILFLDIQMSYLSVYKEGTKIFSLVNVAKKKMQELRSDGWNNFLENVTSFCDKHGIEVPAMDGDYVPYGKSARKAHVQKQTNDDHFRGEVCIGLIDQISQELDNWFDEINMKFLSCISAFNPSK
jgi:hypothetical protein